MENEIKKFKKYTQRIEREMILGGLFSCIVLFIFSTSIGIGALIGSIISWLRFKFSVYYLEKLAFSKNKKYSIIKNYINMGIVFLGLVCVFLIESANNISGIMFIFLWNIVIIIDSLLFSHS